MDITNFCRTEKLVVVEFWSKECIACKFILPSLQEIEEAYKNKFSFIRINLDNNQSCISQYNIVELPTFIFLKNKQLIFRFNGFPDKIKFEKAIRNFI